MRSLISGVKVISKSNRNKDSHWTNLDLVDITTEFTLNFSHDFLPNTRTAAHADLLSLPTSHPEPTPNGLKPDFVALLQKLLKVFGDFSELK